jgi:hypothetical protein
MHALARRVRARPKNACAHPHYAGARPKNTCARALFLRVRVFAGGRRVRARTKNACARPHYARGYAHSSCARTLFVRTRNYRARARMHEPQAIESAMHWAQNVRQSALVSKDYIRIRTHRSPLVLGETWLIPIFSIQRSPDTICLSSTEERSWVSHGARPGRSSPRLAVCHEEVRRLRPSSPHEGPIFLRVVGIRRVFFRETQPPWRTHGS